MSVALEYKIWWQFNIFIRNKMLEGLYGKKLLEGKACSGATFPHTNPLSISCQDLGEIFNLGCNTWNVFFFFLKKIKKLKN